MAGILGEVTVVLLTIGGGMVVVCMVCIHILFP